MQLFRDIYGAGGMGGGGTSTGTEAPDTLKSATHMRTLDLLGEGELEGFFWKDLNGTWHPCDTGGSDDATAAEICKAVYLDRVPIRAADGSYNFARPVFGWRMGTNDQSPISDYPASEVVHSVSVHLSASEPAPIRPLIQGLSELVINIQCNSFFKQDKTSGDVTGTSVTYVVNVVLDGVQRSYPFTLSGKCSSFYVRSHYIHLPSNYSTGSVSVKRYTPDSTTASLVDDIYWESYVEHVGGIYRYPNSAMFQMAINSESFSNLPTRSFRMRLRRIKVPSNYDPLTRTYTGLWDGSFKIAWSNNPAWVYYDVVTNDRFGLGAFFPASNIDKWGLYTAGQYCDQQVPDGFGGTEPRFVCNIYIQSLTEAFDFLRSFVSIFRGMAYWAGDTLMVAQDRDGQSATSIYSPSNVVDGKFLYTTTPMKGRHTVALVSYLDPDDFYERKIEYVEDEEGVRKFGVREIEIQAFGCTSRGQAHRLGRWTLLTELYETETIAFKVGQDSALVRPGQIISIADPLRAGVRWGGRITASDPAGTSISLDSPVTVTQGHVYRLSLINPASDMKAGPLEAPVDGMNDHLTVVEYTATSSGEITSIEGLSLANAPVVGTMWLLEEPGVLQAQQYRVLTVAEDGNGQYSINAIIYYANKYAAVEQNLTLERPPISTGQVLGAVRPPSDITVFDEVEARLEGVTRKVTVGWKSSPDSTVTGYEVEYRYGFNNWELGAKSESISVTFPIRAPAAYDIRVRAVNSFGKASVWVYASHTVAQGFINSSGITNLALVHHGVLTTDFTGTDAEFTWSLHLPQFDFDGADHPTVQFYVVQIRDSVTDLLLRQESVDVPRFLYTIQKNSNDNNGTPQRAFRIVVTASFVDGTFSSAAQLTVRNPAPYICPFPPTIDTSLLRINMRDSRLLISYTPPVDLDFEGLMVFVSTNPAFSLDDIRSYATGQVLSAALVPYNFSTGAGMLAYKGADTLISVDLALNTTYKVFVAAYDSFGTQGMNYYGPASIVIGGAFEVDTTPPNVPSGLTLTTEARMLEDGTQNIRIIAKWTANVEGDLQNYNISIREVSGTPVFNSGNLTGYGGVSQIQPETFAMVPARTNNGGYIKDGSGKVTREFSGLRANVWYEVRVSAEDTSNNVSAWTPENTSGFIQTVKDSIPPAAPTGVKLTAGIRTVLVEWSAPVDADLDYCEVQWSPDNSTWTTLDKCYSGSYMHSFSTTNTSNTQYYRVKAVDTAGNSSGYSVPTPAFVKLQQVQSVDIALGQINTSQIADNAITNQKILDGVVGSTKIADNAVTGTKILDGAVAVNKVAFGIGVNQLPNPGPMKASSAYWGYGANNTGLTTTIGLETATWCVSGEASVRIWANGTPTAGTVFDIVAQSVATNTRFAVVAGKKYEASAYLGQHRCAVYVGLKWYDSAGAILSDSWGAAATGGAGGSTLGSFGYGFVLAVAPANAATCAVMFRAHCVGTANPYLFVCRAFFGEAVVNQTVPSPWSPSANFLAVDGAGITARTVQANAIVAGSLTSNEIAAGTITANNIAASTITANNLAAGSVTAVKIAAQSITASKLVIADNENAFPEVCPVDASFWSANDVTPSAQAGLPQESAPSGRGIYWRESGTAGDLVSGWFTLDMNRQYWITMHTGGNQTPGNVDHYIEWADANSNPIGAILLATRSSWGRWTASFTSSSVSQRARLHVHRPAGYATNQWFIIGPKIYRKASSELIVDGAITADKIAANSITATKIVAGSITATLIAADTITASKMALTSTDSVIRDPYFSDLASSWGITPSASAVVMDAGNTLQPRRSLRLLATSAGDAFQPASPIERGASYRVRLKIFISTDCAGKFAPSIHVPNQYWYVPHPTGNWGDGYPAIDMATTTIPKGSWQTYTGTFKEAEVNSEPSIQARTRWNLTAGYVEFAWEVVRAASADLVVDGAITAVKIAAGTITSDRIAAGTITADRFNAALAFVSDLQVTSGGKIRLGSASAIMTGAGMYLDASNFRVGDPAGAYLYYNSGAGTLTIRGDLQSSNYVAGVSGWKLSNSGAMDLTSLSVGVTDGSITTAKLANGAVNSNKLGDGAVTTNKIPTGTISSVHLNTSSAVITGSAQIANAIINDAHITSLSASKISAASLSAITATIGLLRTATSGARLEIESNQIRVYDSSNVLRVRMGVW